MECDQMFLMENDESFEYNTPKMLSTGKGRTTCSYFMPDNKHILYASTHEANKLCPETPLRVDGNYVWPIYDTYDIYVADLEGNIVNGEVLQNCLGVENTKDFKEKFRLVEEDTLTYADKQKTIVTGKNVFTYAIDTETGKRIDIGYKTYRSKDGAAGKTNNTMTYSKGMQNCFKTGEKP